MEAVLGRRKGTADDYVLRAKIRWAVGMVRARRFSTEWSEIKGNSCVKCYPTHLPVEIRIEAGEFVYRYGGQRKLRLGVYNTRY